MALEIIREDADRLHRQTWGFVALNNMQCDGVTIGIRRYADQSRPTLRHKYRKDKVWGWNTINYHSEYEYSCVVLRQANVPLPDDVIAEAVERIRQNVHFDPEA